jgi:hypothetical protein
MIFNYIFLYKMNKLVILLGLTIAPWWATAQTTCVSITQTARTATTASFSFTLTANSGSPAVADYTIKILPTTGTTGATELTFANGAATPVLPQLLGTTTVNLASGATSVDFSLTLGEVISTVPDVVPVSLCNSTIVLPVELMDFRGQQRDNVNLLSWQTASEKNNIGFDVEKSADGRSFEKMGFVKGHGTSSAAHAYEWTDATPFVLTYYRLKQLDVDGRQNYSKILSIESDKIKTSLEVFPNPTTDKLNVQFESNAAQSLEIELVNTLGQVVQRHSEAVQTGANRFEIPMTGQISGMYTLRLVQGRQVYMRRVCLR